jgi:hypothetical protein
MTATIAETRHWPAEGLTRVPYWLYTDRDIYDEEQARILQGATWSYLCLEAELPSPEHALAGRLRRKRALSNFRRESNRPWLPPAISHPSRPDRGIFRSCRAGS